MSIATPSPMALRAANEVHDATTSCADALRDLLGAFDSQGRTSNLVGAITKILVEHQDLRPEDAWQEAQSIADQARAALNRWNTASETFLTVLATAE